MGGGESGGARPRFDLEVEPGGYAWWYVDAISDDGAYGLTLIAFIGSVFSPYYAWSRKKDPFDHVALNVALYGPTKGRWTMTERPRGSSSTARDVFEIGPSQLSWSDGVLTIAIDELTSPLPRRVRGAVRVHTEALNEIVFPIDDKGLHLWRPVAPAARVEARFDTPALNWTGRGYFDMNYGREPLQSAFEFWDWCRIELDRGETAVFYNTDLVGDECATLGLIFDADGAAYSIDTGDEHPLPPTRVWRIPRRGRSHGAPPLVLQTLEDTPFYSRSIIETSVDGSRRRGVHESFSGRRFRSPIVKAMLPFRMPRRHH
ncbi:MAG: carotenoid 1,2-hydratase [Pseudomonadota bacterium]